MTTILAQHRANLTGPRSRRGEFPRRLRRRARRRSSGLETDLRRDAAGAFPHPSHDAKPRTADNALEAYTALFHQYPDAELAINVKELGYEKELIELMRSGRLGGRSFYFDFELLEPKTAGAAQRKIKSLPHGDAVPRRVRVSVIAIEPLAQCLGIPGRSRFGAMNSDKLWMTEKDAHAVRAAGSVCFT